MNEVFQGLLLDEIIKIPDSSIDLLFTSPPYAEQRKQLYGGIPEVSYPSWTVEWMDQIKRVLRPHGNVAINIRPHVFEGQISDYTLKTRLALREDGWFECDELIWIKDIAPPIGHNRRPRRSWESIHWFSLSKDSFCNPKENGIISEKIGMQTAKRGLGRYINGLSEPHDGIARCRDCVAVGTHLVDQSPLNDHPAQFPCELAEWVIRLLCPTGGVVLDPFIGSGTTAIAALRTGRKFYGIEKEEKYAKIAMNRIQNELEKIPSEDFFVWK